ncbi:MULTISPECIES: mCpol domain-containing protein [Vibrio]|uniref:mCpol domain-containing protein n=1 Tax=Vibrio TaxID=662 RepID=UPI001B304E83|nr:MULTISPECIES: mCpol domain-containing protein [Vibrio]CAH7062624.1 mCpol domain-containing protein [Vibrio chagasii]MCW4446285.1 mCpol domain-containing protein [Vibrio splendidus]CAH7135313.1 mCpol domain-containing protein [Vibrio chagasii]CAK3436612.1 Minimal CRISPR polymerase domain-containing protein [Vibrio crassostreae]CAK3517255.1 Minimal CRISPR polymerase domain-containing protein [Vibrio crassostreae]
MQYISIDGDDVGRLITASYLDENESSLMQISEGLKTSVESISSLLIRNGFEVIFCAADGVLAKTSSKVDFIVLFDQIQECSTINVTFSAGVGDTLKSAYVALIDAKSSGKNTIKVY